MEKPVLLLAASADELAKKAGNPIAGDGQTVDAPVFRKGPGSMGGRQGKPTLLLR